jgi:hypothetical protein
MNPMLCEIHPLDARNMTTNVAYAEIRDGQLVLPADALAILPTDGRLYVLIDSERGTVSIHARDPAALLERNQEFLQSLADLNEGLTLEEYTRPSPDKKLHKGQRGGAGSE